MREDLKTRLKRAFEQEIEPARPDLAEVAFAAIPVGIVAAPGFIGFLHKVVAYVVKHWLTTSAIGLGTVALIGYVVLSRTPDVALYVGYADNRPQPAAALPNPWAGAPNVIFKGVGPTLDAGAIRIDNRTDNEITVDRISVDIGAKHFELWGTGIKIPAHSTLILTQTRILNSDPLQTDFDTSEVKAQACNVVAPEVPIIHLTVNGHHLDFRDTHLVLTTGGHDLGSCPGKPNESHAWEQLAKTQ